MEEMENRYLKNLISDLEDLLSEFDEEKWFYESVYEEFYAYLADSFKDEVEDCCKVVIFGNEYSLDTKKLYAYDSYVAVESWREYVSRALEEEFYEWAKQVIRDDLEDFISRFQQWLSTRNDERAADVIVALMASDIGLGEITVDWLRYRLGYEAWKYPA